MANKIWPSIARTGGAAGSLDAIDGNDLTINDGAMVYMSTFFGSYVLIASTQIESDPLYIVPDANGGGNVWKLI